LYARAGKIISVKEVKPENQLRGSFIIEGEKLDIEVYFTLSPENPPLIQEYHIREVPKAKLN
jgi:SUMO ligase MMS21 Smc5/6 complex component